MSLLNRSLRMSMSPCTPSILSVKFSLNSFGSGDEGTMTIPVSDGVDKPVVFVSRGDAALCVLDGVCAFVDPVAPVLAGDGASLLEAVDRDPYKTTVILHVDVDPQ